MIVSAFFPSAVLWDLDGTLIDSEPAWIDAERELALEYGVEWTDVDGLSLVGKGLLDSGRYLQARGIALTPEEIVERLVASVETQLRSHIPWRPGARDVLQSVKDAGIPQVLVTMSYRSLAQIVIDECGFFTASVTGDEVTHSKPHPEPYLAGARAVSVDIMDCVAFEDSVPGTSSAVASGATTIAVPLHAPLPESPENYELWHSLVGRGLEDIAAVHSRRKGR